MSSNDKTSDLLVATTRATKADSGADATTAAQPVAATKAPAAKKASAKKAVAKKKAPPRKAAAKKPPAKKAAAKSQKEMLVNTFAFGQRVWPD